MLDIFLYYVTTQLGFIELIGSIFSLICVYLAAKHNIWTWFFGILGVLCFGYLFLHPSIALYFDGLLQLLFYLPIQFIGWYFWKQYSIHTSAEVVKSFSSYWWLAILPAIAVATYFSAGVLISVGGSFPVLDSIIVWSSIVAQILLTKKFWQSWVLWISVDVLGIYVYFGKGLFVTSGLYGIFLIIAIVGLVSWIRKYKEIKNA